MKEFIKESFEQNPDALQKLLATRNATLTHNPADAEWSTAFPRILMEVRDELRSTDKLTILKIQITIRLILHQTKKALIQLILQKPF